ncbi:Fic family protein [Flavobacterium sp.]|uniref:Fic family protein n=1 Tax=Flavobacterium sp. TaxID=239 RepID=UPI003752CAA9
MILLPLKIIHVNFEKISQIDAIVKSIYRLIIYSRHNIDDDLLDIYLNSMHDLKDLLGIKNAQMEAQNEEEAEEYLVNLKKTLDFVVEEIILDNNFVKELQLFQLLRLISPETNDLHLNRYRDSVVQIGAYVCPEPNKVPQLVSELFYKMLNIKNPIIRAIYFHHELIRIHPFADGNGRVTRIAKNWMLMYNLYPPIFINDAVEKKEYINTLSNSFKNIDKFPNKWNLYTANFFDQELDRLLTNVTFLYNTVYKIGAERQSKN